MRNLFTIAITVLFSSFVLAQGDYDDLLITKADQNWDKLIRKAEKYTVANSTKKDPEPYYYLAYGLYKISSKSDRDDKYKNAYKESFTAASKMLRYDKSGMVTEKYAEFIEDLKTSLLEIIQNELDVEQYPRAFGWAMRFYKFGRDYAPAYYLDGALRYRKADRTTANIKWRDGDKLLEEQNVADWTDADRQVLMIGLYASAKALKEDRQMQLAKDMMNKGAPYFEDNEKWADLYDDVVN